jgi:hypothetical protein
VTPLPELARNYVASSDRRLRESFEPDSAHLPPFQHDFQNREETHGVNIFLVAISAEIKIRRYFKMIQQHPPTFALPDDVLTLMRRVVELVDLLYWAPVPTKGSKGEAILAERALLRHNNPEGARRYLTSGGESGEGPPIPIAWKWSGRSRRLAAYADLETRKAYGSALMSGHDKLSLHSDL